MPQIAHMHRVYRSRDKLAETYVEHHAALLIGDMVMSITIIVCIN